MRIPFHQERDRITIKLLGETDVSWIAGLVDEAEASLGQPWRELVRRLSELEPRTSAARRTAAIAALERTLGRRNGRGFTSARVRQQVLGAPVFTADSRAARISGAAAALAMSSDEVEAALWADLPGERLVTMPSGRPAELALAAAANLEILQRVLRRAFAVRMCLWGSPRKVARVAALQGLLATARTAPGDHAILDVSGPLALFHRTTVYGRALGTLVRSLAWCERFTVEIECDLGRGRGIARVASPVLLPPAPPPRRYDSALETRFARDMARGGPSWRLVREPEVVATEDGHLLFPDFMLVNRDAPERRWWIEILGFWTADYLAHKLSRYRAARLDNLILCIDADRAQSGIEVPAQARIVRFSRRIDPRAILQIVE